MLLLDGILQLSGSDLVGHLNCRHLTELEKAAAKGELQKVFNHDPLLRILAERGREHERGYVEHLRASGFEVHEVSGNGVTGELVEETSEAMRKGVEVISQGAFTDGRWRGRTDILRRVEVPSRLGSWSYEVIDTKLAMETKGGTILQLSLYSELLAAIQGMVPERMYVVTPWTDYVAQEFRIADYGAYYRYVKGSLEESASLQSESNSYPDPKSHCDICHWRVPCEVRRREDDHLWLVAGITKMQINELQGRAVETMRDLAEMSLPLAWKPDRGSSHSYEKIREQARLQVQGRDSGQVLYEALSLVPGFGLCSLPEPSPGDIFFDLEGDPFAGEGGLEYLFGYVVIGNDGKPEYSGNWVLSRAEEKAAFEGFIDYVVERRQQFPGLHIYHYAPYEPSALKRLMGRYATREEEVDQMLRSKVFVDLYSVVRHAIRASVESYSIKKLEPLYNFNRNAKLSEASTALAKVQACIELGDAGGIPEAAKQTVIDYNQDDCVSTFELRQWLEVVREDLRSKGHEIARPVPEDSVQSENVTEWLARINPLIERLTADVPANVEERTNEQQARWILANILDWHRREDKATWWEYFRLSELDVEGLMEERAGLAGLELVGNVGGTARAPIERYRFPPQETEFKGDEDLMSLGGEKYGSVARISVEERTVDIKKRGDTAGVHAEAVFAHSVVRTNEQAEALFRIAQYVVEHGLAGDGPYQAARDLLLKLGPRIAVEESSRAGESVVELACQLALIIQGGVLPIQGPPGSGKTYTGARMICELVRAGKRVGVTANSHKVIRNLLDAVLRAAAELHVDVRCVQKAAEREEDQERLIFANENGDLFSALRRGCQVAGGTAWVWSREEAFETVDVLFVDEAAQMSLANVLAISHAGKTVVLLGDPQQLEQPIRGSHPEGTDVSALDHVLDGHQTIPAGKGLFLGETWRLHPEICGFTSELFYEGRLVARSGLEMQEVRSSGVISGRGLRYLPVLHEGNQNASPQEAESVAHLVRNILSSRGTWVDREGVERPLGLNDIVIIAPYNAQVFEIQSRLPGARVGTVDKFQGQEAPIAIYSLTTSTHADAPRGMEFLYSSNRLNVATSRAKCVSVVVGCPALFEPECRTPRQMQLANAFCRYLELATPIAINGGGA